MKSKLQVHRIPIHSDEWYAFRRNGIGGSDIGGVMMMNKNESRAKIFYEKIGDREMDRQGTPNMHWGREEEPVIAENWKYWDGREFGYIENKEQGKVIRRCKNINGFIVNPDYPWLFGSIDRLINKEGGINMITGEPLKEEGILECKNQGYWASKVWDEGFPIYFTAQIMTYMIILEVSYAEIAILTAGNDFDVIPVSRNETLCEQIINITKDWWYNVVVPAKEAREKRIACEISGNIKGQEQYTTIIQNLEPPPDDSNIYSDFMNENFVKEREFIEGNFKQWDLCKEDEMLKQLINKLGEKRNLIKNTLIHDLSKAGAEVIDFDALGKFTWSMKKGSKNRTALVSIKEKPSEDRIEEEFKKLNFNY